MLTALAEKIQQSVNDRLAGVVSKCLAAVFGEDAYEFRINLIKRKSKTDAELVFLRDGKEIDPTTAAGGGAVDVAAFALRLACLVLKRPAARRVLILDEPFRFVSAEYRDAVRELLETVSSEMKVQIIQITHSPELVCGEVVQI